jgi:hypothetical protein
LVRAEIRSLDFRRLDDAARAERGVAGAPDVQSLPNHEVCQFDVWRNHPLPFLTCDKTDGFRNPLKCARVEEHRLALARELLKHQTFDAAIVVLEQSAGPFPQSIGVKVLLGLAYYLVDRSADSIRTLLAAMKLDPKEALAARYLGEITLQDTAAPDPSAVAQICAFADGHPASTSAGALCGGVLLRVSEETGDVARMPEILRRLEQVVRIAPQEPLTAGAS